MGLQKQQCSHRGAKILALSTRWSPPMDVTLHVILAKRLRRDGLHSRVSSSPFLFIGNRVFSQTTPPGRSFPPTTPLNSTPTSLLPQVHLLSISASGKSWLPRDNSQTEQNKTQDKVKSLPSRLDKVTQWEEKSQR